MKIVIGRDRLLVALGRCASVVPARATVAGLECVSICADDDGNVVFNTTNLYANVSDTVKCADATPGSIAVPAKMLLERVRAMSSGTVTLTADGDRVSVRGDGARRFDVLGMSTEHVAKPEPRDDGKRSEIAADELALALSIASHAALLDDSRPGLNGVLLTSEKGKLVTVATDGSRLVHVKTDAPFKVAKPLLVPLRAASEIAKLADSLEDGESFTIGVFDRHVCVTRASVVEYWTKLVDATFPPYEQVMKVAAKHRVTLDRAALLDAVRAVTVASETKGIWLRFSRETLRIEASSPTGGTGTDELAIECDAEVSIGINGRYLADALSAHDAARVQLAFGGGLDPMVVTNVDDVGMVVTELVMPMRL